MSFNHYITRLATLLGLSSENKNTDYQELMAVNNSKFLYDDIYVVHYDFSTVEGAKATEEFQTLVTDLSAAGLKIDITSGPNDSLLLLVKSPFKLLGRAIHKSRVKDWLYGVAQQRPEGNKHTAVHGDTESENLRSMFHLVTWNKNLGGAGISPGHGQWENVKASFPLHNRTISKALLLKWSRQFILRVQDLDDIRAIFGEKVAFYFAFLQAYLVALLFPSITGILAWLYLPNYSLLYGISTSLWCTVFLEYWRVKEVDLSLRWGVKGVGSLKVNRDQFVFDKEVIDPITGELQQHFSHLKQIMRQVLQVPFTFIAVVGLGTLISAVFVVEILVSEMYTGPFKFYLEYLPTVLLAISLPFISSRLEDLASRLAEYENHRTEDRHEMALTQKIFVLSSITKYLPILLTAFVYVPFGNILVERIHSALLKSNIGTNRFSEIAQFNINGSRLREEVVALVVTEQLLGFGEELIWPVVKRKITRWYGERQARTSGFFISALDHPSRASIEVDLLAQARNEAELEKYNVQEDIQQMVIQFGYLALFSPVWPLIPVGFLINNWIELRSDFLKICIEHRRPPPIRADSIGPWLESLGLLNWLGSISTAAIVHLFQDGSSTGSSMYALAVTIFVSEHIYLAVRYLVRLGFQRLGSDAVRKDLREQYVRRKQVLDEFESDAMESAKGEEDRLGIDKNDEASSAKSTEFGIRLITTMTGKRDVKKKV